MFCAPNGLITVFFLWQFNIRYAEILEDVFSHEPLYPAQMPFSSSFDIRWCIIQAWLLASLACAR